MIETLGFFVLQEDLEFLRNLSAGAQEILEVGSGVGVSASALAEGGATVHCVDTWQGTNEDSVHGLYHKATPRQIFETFCANAGDKLFKKIFPHIGPSLLYASVWPRKLDLIFIDAAHDYKSVKADIEAWAPHVKEGGILCGHDYGCWMEDPKKELFPGVRMAVDEFGKDGMTGSVWWKRISSK